MKINRDKIEQLTALLSGSLKGLEKKALLEELQKDTELSGTFELLKKMSEIAPKNLKPVLYASQKLSKKLYKDFLKEKASTDKQFGVQIYDSSLLPLPEGVRPASVDTRLLKYHVGEAVVEISIYPITIDSVELIGQISGVNNTQRIEVKALVKNKVQKTKIDEFGLFRFNRIEAGGCRLIFSFENDTEGVIDLSL